jgi:mannose-6-phosphate isomerase-like protein (cupin superfamily)
VTSAGGDRPVNLTLLAEHLPQGEATSAVVMTAEGIRFEVVISDRGPRPDPAGDPHATLYVITAGHGVLRSGGEPTEVTAGDLVLMPAGAEHRFEALSARFKTWRISFPPRRDDGPQT